MTRSRSELALMAVMLGALSLATAMGMQQDSDPTPAPSPTPAESPKSQPETPATPTDPASTNKNPIEDREEVEREPKVGDTVRLTYTDGRAFEGVVEKLLPGLIELRISGASVKLEFGSQDKVRVLESVRDRYKAVRATIDNDDSEKLLALVAWLEKQRMYDEALFEVEGILQRDPNHPDALRQRRMLASLIDLRDRRRAEGPGSSQPTTERPVAPKRPSLDEFPLITQEQVNLIKVYELDLRDPPRIVIPRPTIEKLLTRYSDNPLIPSSREGRESFARLPPEEILGVMFRVQARDLYGEVQVVGNPKSMEYFRDRVHSTWLVNDMATTRCHGGSASGRLRLFNRRSTAEQSVYTNYLILDRFVTSDGRKLIDYASPESSLLLQMALPRNDSRNPHPDVPGWKPAFANRESRRYKQAIEWIRMMYRPRPEYPIEYTPPGQAEDVSPAPKPGTPSEEPVPR